MVRWVGQYDIEAAARRSLDGAGGERLKGADAIGPRILLRQPNCPDVAVDEGCASSGTAAKSGENAVGAAAAAQIEDAITRVNRHGFDQGSRPIVEPAVGEHAWPGQE